MIGGEQAGAQGCVGPAAQDRARLLRRGGAPDRRGDRGQDRRRGLARQAAHRRHLRSGRAGVERHGRRRHHAARRRQGSGARRRSRGSTARSTRWARRGIPPSARSSRPSSPPALAESLADRRASSPTRRRAWSPSGSTGVQVWDGWIDLSQLAFADTVSTIKRALSWYATRRWRASAVAATSLRGALDATLAALPAQLREPGTGGAACRAIAEVYDRAIARAVHGRARRASRRRSRWSRPAAGRAASSRRTPTSTSSCCTIATRPRAKQVSRSAAVSAVGREARDRSRGARAARGGAAREGRPRDRDRAARRAPHRRRSRGSPTELVRATLGALAPGGNPNELIAALAAEKQRAPRSVRRVALPARAEPQAGHRRAARSVDRAVGRAVRWHPPRPERDPPGAERADREPRRDGPPDAPPGRGARGARDFQLRLRALVQLAARRRFDQLTFEIQEAIAPALYPDAHRRRRAPRSRPRSRR